MSFQNDDNFIPSFFELLKDEDKQKYWELHKTISTSDKRYKMNKRLESLQESFDMIHEFCIRHDSDDWKRCLICGICWINQNIAINNRHLCFLVDKCKSSINGALTKMGYKTAPINSSFTKDFLEYIPFLKGNFIEQRQWTVRHRVQFSPIQQIRDDFIPNNPNQYKTPEPQIQNFNLNTENSEKKEETFDKIEIESVFGVNIPKKSDQDQNNEKINDNKNKSTPNSTNFFENSNDFSFNFLTDPCSCCPLSWAFEEVPSDDFFTMS